MATLVVLGTAMSWPARAVAPTPANWFEAKFRLPAATTSFGVHLGLVGQRPSPDVVGVGFSLGGASAVSLFDLGGTGGSITTTRSLGSVRIDLSPMPNGGFQAGTGVSSSSPEKAGSLAALLVFVPEASARVVSAYAVVGGRRLPVTLSQGSGSALVHVANPRNAGIGIGTPAASGGMVTAEADLASPVVGVMNSACVSGTCLSGWQAPGGRSGTFLVAGTSTPLLGGSGYQYPATWYDFCGPAGHWLWSLIGVEHDDILAAYAPIGNDWRLFDNHSYNGPTYC